MSSSTPTTEGSNSLLRSAETFFTTHKRAILLGTAATAALLAVGGAVYYSSSNTPAPRKSRKSKPKRASSAKEQEKDKEKSDTSTPAPVLDEVPLLNRPLHTLSPSERENLAQILKAQGNDAYKEKKYAHAVELYTKAIETLSPKESPVFYSNRAACYMNLSPPEYELVIADCTRALDLDSKYIKALNRRANAYEALAELNIPSFPSSLEPDTSSSSSSTGVLSSLASSLTSSSSPSNPTPTSMTAEEKETVKTALQIYTTALQNALHDFTSSTFIQKFNDPGSATSVERILKKVSEIGAKAIVYARFSGEDDLLLFDSTQVEGGSKQGGQGGGGGTLRLPGAAFIGAYFAAFRDRPLPSLPESTSESDVPSALGDEVLIKAFEALKARDYTHAFSLVNEALDMGVSEGELRAEALNLRGTFKFLTGLIQSSLRDLELSLEQNPNFTQSLVKLASVHMELNEVDKAFECFDKAEKIDEKDPDVWYHRGQVLFILSRFEEAAKNYQMSTNLDPTFVFSHIQLAVAEYKNGQTAKALIIFRRTLNNEIFKNRSEVPNYYGEILLDQQRHHDAVAQFDKAIEIERVNAANSDSAPGPMNVLPLVNKALAVYQWKQDFDSAERYCLEALAIDPTSEAAIATLAQFNLQQGRISKAIEYLEKQVEQARTEPELVAILGYLYASKSQLVFQERYPDLASQLAQLAQTI